MLNSKFFIFCNTMESVGDVAQITSVKTGNWNSTVSSHIDSVPLTKIINHSFIKTCKGKHSNLVYQVIPVMLSSWIYQFSAQTDTHLLHTARHHLKIVVPQLCELLVSEYNVNNTSPMDWWVRVESSSENFYARHHSFFLIWVSCNNTHATSTLTIKPEVLGERLEKHDVI